MYSRRFKTAYFALEGVNSFAASFFFTYLFFHLRDRFGFGNTANLLACAVHGLVFTCSAWFGGRFAQRAGYLVSILLGFAIMGGSVLVGWLLAGSVIGQMLVLAVWTFGMCFTWPALEALASEQESPESLPRMIGIYNVTWAAGSALATFVGGAVIRWLGESSLFWVPALLHSLQVMAVLVIRRQVGTRVSHQHGSGEIAAALLPRESHPAALAPAPRKQTPSGVPPATFLRMAWLANPFAYVAMNALIPVIPLVARELQLTTEMAGYFCSVWLFGRLAAFFILWKWTGWHYRFRWLLGAFVIVIAGFATVLLSRHLLLMIVAQAAFGMATGLIYYSSLFYSMDVGDTKGEHGGLHEAAIGSGVLGGATIGAAGQWLLGGASSSTWVVTGVLVLGLAGLVFLRGRGGKAGPQ